MMETRRGGEISGAEFVNVLFRRFGPWYRVEMVELGAERIRVRVGGVLFSCWFESGVWKLELDGDFIDQDGAFRDRLNGILRGGVRDDFGNLRESLESSSPLSDVFSVSRMLEIMSRDIVPGEWDIGREVEFSQDDGVWVRLKLLSILPEGKVYRFISEDTDADDDWLYWKKSRIIKG